MQASVATIRVLIADDHAVVREGIRGVLSRDEEFEVVGEAADGAEAVRLAGELTPDVVVLDISMPGMSGLDAAARISESVPGTCILMLSIHDHEEYVLRSLRAGAHGYLRKDSSPAELRGAIRALHKGGSFFSGDVARTLSSALRSERRVALLSAREREVLVGIARGRTNKEIGASLGISVRTVESHRDSLMKKLDVHGTAALTRFALENGLTGIDESR